MLCDQELLALLSGFFCRHDPPRRASASAPGLAGLRVVKHGFGFAAFKRARAMVSVAFRTDAAPQIAIRDVVSPYQLGDFAKRRLLVALPDLLGLRLQHFNLTLNGLQSQLWHIQPVSIGMIILHKHL